MSTTDEIIKYVMESPSNTNPAILRELLSEHGAGGSSGGGGPVKLSITHTVQDVNGTSYDYFYLNYTWRELKDFLDDGRVFIYESSDGVYTEQLVAIMVGGEVDGEHVYAVNLIELFSTPALMREDLAAINPRMSILFEGTASFTCQDEDSRPSASVPVQSGNGGTTGK